MATGKQVKMLLARSAEAGFKAAWSDFADLDNGQIDEKLAEIAGFKAGGQEVGCLAPAKQQPAYNGQRFGLACKIVLNNVNHDFVFNNKDIYIKRILQYYWIMTEAEAAQKEQVVVGEVDADQLLDEQKDKALVAAGLM